MSFHYCVVVSYEAGRPMVRDRVRETYNSGWLGGDFALNGDVSTIMIKGERVAEKRLRQLNENGASFLLLIYIRLIEQGV